MPVLHRRLPVAAITLAASLACACAEPRATGRPVAGSTAAPPPAAPETPAAPAIATAPAASATAGPAGTVSRATYGWLDAEQAGRARSLEAAFPAPEGHRRVAVEAGSFGAFLRGLPLHPPGTPVHTHRGDELRRGDDPRVAAVIALDVGSRDLQQCADTALRLHAEWLWSRGEESALGYHFTSGDLATWDRHRAGERPIVDGARVRWSTTAAPSSGRDAFRRWLDLVFTYAGTVSLARHAAPVTRDDLRPGDVFVLPGGPGHAVLVLDVAESTERGRVALLGQGFMPAQEAHVLAAAPGVAWFDLDVDAIDTPFWPEPFPWSALRRMRTARGATE